MCRHGYWVFSWQAQARQCCANRANECNMLRHATLIREQKKCWPMLGHATVHHCAACCTQRCWGMLCQRVASVWTAFSPRIVLTKLNWFVVILIAGIDAMFFNFFFTFTFFVWETLGIKQGFVTLLENRKMSLYSPTITIHFYVVSYAILNILLEQRIEREKA